MFKEKGAAPAGGLFTWSHFGLLAFFFTCRVAFLYFYEEVVEGANTHFL